MTLRTRGVTWHATRLKTGAGVSATIRRRGTSQTLTGWLAEVQYDVMDDGVMTVLTFHDWNFAKADLTWTPQQGDEITATINSVARTFVVQPPPNGKVIEDKDSSGIEVVVHTDEITCPQS